MLIDTHCHLASAKFPADEMDEIVRRAIDAGVTRIVTIGTNLDDCWRNIALTEKYPEVFATVGIHPTDVLDLPEGTLWLEEIGQMLGNSKVIAIGEIGLDYFHPPNTGSVAAYHTRQAEVFRAQMEFAADQGYNIVIHQRESYEDTVAAVEPFDSKLRAVFHCFTGTIDQAKALLERGHLVSFTGIVTFKNARDVQECATSVPAGSFMVETDAPYLAPVPHRGKRCEPTFTRHTAEHLAKLRGVTIDELAAETTATAEAFFKFAS
jgi:TatD DNase family protein